MKPTTAHKAFQESVMEQGCCVCGRPAIFHHVSLPHGLPRRHDMWGAALCDDHHTQYHGKECATVARFLELHDVDLVNEAIRNFWKYND